MYGQIIFEETILEVVAAPWWWYTRGLKRAIQRSVTRIREANELFGFTLWLRHLFVPMYGQADLAGRFISFFVRLVQVLARGVVLLFWVAVSLLLLIGYILIPVVAVRQIIWPWL